MTPIEIGGAAYAFLVLAGFLVLALTEPQDA